MKANVAQPTAALLESHTMLSTDYSMIETSQYHAKIAEHKATQTLNDLRTSQTVLNQSGKQRH